MIGRRAELQVLLDAFAAGREGHPRGVVVRGEAGIGKTRLLEEFRAIALAFMDGLPVVVAYGQCVDLGPIGAPFTAIRRLLHEVYTAVGDEEFRAAAGSPSVIATLAALVPELEGGGGALASGGEYVVEAIERIVENLSERFHLILIIEDLHWADAATLALLKTLAVTLRGRHATLIMTYRSDDVGRGHPLRAVLAELDRSRIVKGLQVPRLTDEEIEQQVRGLADRPVDADALRAITARSEGVPFFVEELFDLTGQPMPDTLRAVVLARFERLSAGAREVVGLVAVGGVHVDGEVLSAVYAGDPAALRDGLREAIAESVLVNEHGGYSFRHALIQEAVQEDLLPTDRVEAHTAYASILQKRVDGGEAALAAEAAEHWLAARDVVRAFESTVTARRWSAEANAPASAAKLGERLLELWPQVPDAEARARMSRAEIALEIARDYDDVGEWERSLRAAQAGAGFTGPDDRLLRVRLLIEVANRQRYLNRWAEGIATFHEARALLDEDGDAAERALLARIDAPLVADDERNWPNAVELIDRAVALAESSGDSTALSIALDRRAYVQAACLGVDSALENERRAHSLPGSMDRRMKTSNNLMDILSKAGRYDEALEIGRSAYDEAVLGGRGRGLGASILANLAETEAFLGNVDSSIALGERAILLLPDPDQQKLVLRVLATATMWDARSDQSGIYLERAKSTRATGTELDEEIAWLQFDGYAALVAAGLEGQVDDATGLAARIADQFDSFPGTQFEGMRWFSERLLPLAGWLLQRAPEVRDILRPSTDRALARPDSGKHSAAWKSVGLAFRDSGVAPWREAVARTEEGRMPTVFVHLSRLRLAEALIAEGERDEASILLDRVMEEAPMHGATLVANWAREIAVRAGLTPSGTDAAPLAVVLTPRERQVLALVAEGLTNPQIGARLYISPKTASVHVSAILTKIGAANRTEAAAIYSASPAPRPAAVVSL